MHRFAFCVCVCVCDYASSTKCFVKSVRSVGCWVHYCHCKTVRCVWMCKSVLKRRTWMGVWLNKGHKCSCKANVLALLLLGLVVYLTLKYGPGLFGGNTSTGTQGFTQRGHTSADKEPKDRGQAPFFCPFSPSFRCTFCSGWVQGTKRDGWVEGGKDEWLLHS